MTMDFFNRTMQPGTPIGCIAATNFGEITSQLLLQSFHHSGIKSMNISGGIQRINQLLNRTCKTSKENILCFARIKDDIYDTQRLFYIKCDEYKDVIKILMKDRCEKLIRSIKIIRFEEIIEKFFITECENNCHFYNCVCSAEPHCAEAEIPDPAVSSTEESLKFKDDINSSLNIEQQANKSKIKNVYIFPIDFEMENLKKINELIKLEFEILENQCIIYFDSIEDAVHFNIVFLNLTVNENNFLIDYEFNYEINDFLLVFKGVTLNTLLKIDFLDKNSIYSNDIFENDDFFGIETARLSLYNEIERVCKFDGADISKCFISFICDAMTYNGKITSITNLEDRVVTNALFEKPIKKIISYSLSKIEENCDTMESAVLLGNFIKMGTYFSDIIKI